MLMSTRIWRKRKRNPGMCVPGAGAGSRDQERKSVTRGTIAGKQTPSLPTDFAYEVLEFWCQSNLILLIKIGDLDPDVVATERWGNAGTVRFIELVLS